ncbi:hypothetical protein EVAR_93201_1 [Eumeta japonica]|uniref:Uncharacterized protein n=1 Tax=Eumeta variegata TaxID=151549 RepID=A0A4C1TXI7_EUMVA|nr:hypothetical protein EVAR_93201_1 [Eumeta japonica]
MYIRAISRCVVLSPGACGSSGMITCRQALLAISGVDGAGLSASILVQSIFNRLRKRRTVNGSEIYVVNETKNRIGIWDRAGSKFRTGPRFASGTKIESGNRIGFYLIKTGLKIKSGTVIKVESEANWNQALDSDQDHD